MSKESLARGIVMPVDPNCGIYVITSPSGNQYVGQSCKIRERWWQHQSSLRTSKHHSVLLQRAFHKYGEGSLRFEIWCNCAREHLNEMEILAESELRPAYNSAACGELAPMRGRTHTPEARAKLSAAHTGRSLPREVAEKVSAALKGRPKSPEHVARVAAALLGKKRSPEAIEATARKLRGQQWSAERRAKYLKFPDPVLCIETGKVYANAAEAARGLGVRSNSILNVCRGLKKTTRGLHWTFAECSSTISS